MDYNSIEEKHYDIIFFSRVVKSKGIEDLIKAIGIVKKTISNIKVVIVGSVRPNYLEFLKDLAIKSDCLENIDFKGFIPTQDKIYQILHRSRLFMLPAYIGDVSGGMIESMARKIPVISYKTDGINRS